MPSVRSFAQGAYLEMLSSSIFYPSNQELRPVEPKKSIKESLGTHSELFNSRELQSNWHYYGKPVRAVARVVLAIGIATIAAPTGIVFHGCATVGYGIMWLRSGNENAAHNWQKIKHHAISLFVDFLVSSISLLGFGSVVFIKHFRGEELKFALGIIATLGFVLFYCGTAPQKAAPYLFLSSGERAAVYKAIRLRNDFGIVAKGNNGLLPFDDVEDAEEFNFKGSLSNLWKCQALDLLLTVKKLKTFFPKHGGNSKTLTGYHAFMLSTNGPGGDDLKEVNKVIDRAIKDSQTPNNAKQELRTLKEEYNTLSQNMVRMHAILHQCLVITKKDIFSFFDPTISLEKFPFNVEFMKKHFYNDEPGPAYNDDDDDSEPQPTNLIDSWAQFLNTRQALPESLPRDITDEDCQAVFTRVKSKELPLKLFGFEQMPNSSELKQRYRKLMLKLHPDKHAEKNKPTMDILFQCITQAFTLLSQHAQSGNKANAPSTQSQNKQDEKGEKTDDVD